MAAGKASVVLQRSSRQTLFLQSACSQNTFFATPFPFETGTHTTTCSNTDNAFFTHMYAHVPKPLYCSQPAFWLPFQSRQGAKSVLTTSSHIGTPAFRSAWISPLRSTPPQLTCAWPCASSCPLRFPPPPQPQAPLLLHACTHGLHAWYWGHPLAAAAAAVAWVQQRARAGHPWLQGHA